MRQAPAWPGQGAGKAVALLRVGTSAAGPQACRRGRANDMRVRLVRRPGQHGTRAYVEQYGDRLICVRYRYDEAARRRYKTVEIIVEEAPWSPARPVAEAPPAGRISPGPAAAAMPPKSPAPAGRGSAAEPAPSEASGTASRTRGYEDSELVAVRLPVHRRHLTPTIARAGGQYRRLLDIWAVRYDTAVALGLHRYIVDTVAALSEAWNRRYTSGS